MTGRSGVAEPATPPRQPARERILDVAGPLFHREGYPAVGVDRVSAEAGVAKATFYKHFPSKDDLIVAFMERAEARHLARRLGAVGQPWRPSVVLARRGRAANSRRPAQRIGRSVRERPPR